MARDVTTILQYPQQIEAVVTGPDGANRLYHCTGAVGGGGILTASDGAESKETFVFTVGPTLTRRQVIRAIAAAALAGTTMGASGASPSGPGQMAVRIESADADWDDERDHVQARIELVVRSAPGMFVVCEAISYQVTILAEVA